MQLVRLMNWLIWTFSVSAKRDLSNRSNFWFEAVAAAFAALSGLVALSAVYGYTQSLAGWTEAGAVVLYGTFLVVSGFVSAFVEPNLSFFQGKVVNGELDDALIKPMSSLVTVSLGTCSPLALLQSVTGIVIAASGWLRLGEALTVSGAAAYIVLLITGIVVAWASRVLLACLAFWFPGTEPSVLYNAFWDLGRYPITVYPRTVRFILTWVVPVAFISTLPATAIQGKAAVWLPAAGALIALLAAYTAAAIWKLGLKRYTGATG